MGGLARRLGCDCCWRPCFKRWVEVTSAAAPGRATGIALRKTEYSVPFGRHSWNGWAPPAVAAAGVRRGFISRLTIIFPRPGFSSSFFWPETLLSTICKTHCKSGGWEEGKALSFAKKWRLFLNWQKCKELPSLWQSFLLSPEESPQVFGPGYTSFLLSIFWHVFVVSHS